MSARQSPLPFFYVGHVHRASGDAGSQHPRGLCPPGLARELAINGLVPDEQTDRRGNCGVDAFVRSLTQQPGLPRGRGQSEATKRRSQLQRSEGKKATLARNLGVKWLADHARDALLGRDDCSQAV